MDDIDHLRKHHHNRKVFNHDNRNFNNQHRILDDIVKNKKSNLNKINNKMSKYDNNFENDDNDDDNYNDNDINKNLQNNNDNNNDTKNNKFLDKNKISNRHNGDSNNIERTRKWICIKCKRDNDHLEHCEYCATKKATFTCTPENMKQLRL
jgi:hypothetical protein